MQYKSAKPGNEMLARASASERVSALLVVLSFPSSPIAKPENEGTLFSSSKRNSNLCLSSRARPEEAGKEGFTDSISSGTSGSESTGARAKNLQYSQENQTTIVVWLEKRMELLSLSLLLVPKNTMKLSEP